MYNVQHVYGVLNIFGHFYCLFFSKFVPYTDNWVYKGAGKNRRERKPAITITERSPIPISRRMNSSGHNDNTFIIRIL